jgi:hypothetical protein
MKSLEEVRENFKNKIRLNKNSKKLKNYSPRLYGIFTKLMLLLVIFLSFLIIIKGSPQYKKIITNKLFQENIPFMKINNLYTTYLGNLFPFSNMFLNTKPVFKEKLVYQDLSKYKDGVCLKVDKNYLVPVKESGIVIFIGEQEDYQKTVIIQEASGIEIWYVI